jgi:hypothetical protein
MKTTFYWGTSGWVNERMRERGERHNDDRFEKYVIRG